MVKCFLLVCSLVLAIPIAVAQANNQSITAQTLGNMEAAEFTVAGECLSFSSSEDYIATSAGVFAIVGGMPQIEFAESTDFVYFSPDERWVLSNGFLYEVATGEQVIERNPAGVAAFSMDGQYIHINYDTYDVDTWEIAENIPGMLVFEFPNRYRPYYEVAHTFALGNGIPRYLSPSQNFWVVVNFVDDLADEGTRGGIYDASTGERIAIPDEIDDPVQLNESFFSPDDGFFFAYNGDVYDTVTWEKRYQLTRTSDNGNPEDGPFFFADNQYFTLSNQMGIFATATGELVFEVDVPASVSQDGQWVATATTVYELATGEVVFETEEPAPYSLTFSFSPDNNHALHFADGVYDLRNGTKLIALDDTMRDSLFISDGSVLYIQTFEHELLMYDMTDGALIATFASDGFVLSPSETRLAIAETLNEEPQCTVYAVQ